MKFLFTCIMLWEFATVIYGKTFYAVDDTAYDDETLSTGVKVDDGSKIIFEEDSNKKFYETPVRRPPSRGNDDKEVRGDSGRRTTYINNGGKINNDRRSSDSDGDNKTDERIFFEDPALKTTGFKDDDKDFKEDAVYLTAFDGFQPKKSNEDPDIKISYKDLEDLNADCYPWDTCSRRRSFDSPGITENYSCSCDRQCSKFGTCCVDSPDRMESRPLYKCVANEVPAGADGYYMVNKCPPNTDANSIWKSPCEDEWRGEDNILRIAPVTSLDTNTTYKNYYCLRCHESTDNFFLYWELFLQTDDINEELRELSDFVISYNQEEQNWYARSLRRGTSMAVKLKFVKPKGDDVIAIECNRKVISDCPESWSDNSVRDKCHAYSALLYRRGSNLVYKNVHCAICNSENYRYFRCEKPEDESITTSFRQWSRFNFARLIDVNYRNKGKIAKRPRCDGNYLWDPFGQQCRKLVCVRPGHVVVDGKCSPR